MLTKIPIKLNLHVNRIRCSAQIFTAELATIPDLFPLCFGGANEIVGLIATFAFKLLGFSAHAIRIWQGYILLMSLGLFLVIFGGTALYDFGQAKHRIITTEANKEVDNTHADSSHN